MIPQRTPTSHVPYYRVGDSKAVRDYQQRSILEIENAMWYRAALRSIYSAQLPVPAIKPLGFAVPGYRAFDLVTRRKLWGYSERNDAWTHARSVMQAPVHVHRTPISAALVNLMLTALKSYPET